MPPSQRVSAELVSATMLSPTVRAMTLQPRGPALDFEPGQWLNVCIPDHDPTLKRAFSIANAPRTDGSLELAVTRVEGGAMSPALHALAVGSSLEIEGPQGFFSREAGAQPALFVGAGTGLAPLRSMLEAAISAGESGSLGLLFGCRTPQDILWRDQLKGWAERGVRVEVSLSRPPGDWSGRTGYVQTHVADLARTMGEPDVYICGLSHLVKDVRKVLKGDLGYDRRRIHSERYD